MPVTDQQMQAFCETIVRGRDAAPDLTLNDYLADVPRLESLADLPSGTPVLVRGDTDAKPGATIGEGDIRLRSMVETLKYGVEKGWKQVDLRPHRPQARGIAREGRRAVGRAAQDQSVAADQGLGTDTDTNEINAVSRRGGRRPPSRAR